MATRLIAGQTILIPVARRPENFDAVFVLNPSSAALWQHLAQPRAAAELAELLIESYAATEEVEVKADVAAFLSSMLAYGAIDALPN